MHNADVEILDVTFTDGLVTKLEADLKYGDRNMEIESDVFAELSRDSVFMTLVFSGHGVVYSDALERLMESAIAVLETPRLSL